MYWYRLHWKCLHCIMITIRWHWYDTIIAQFLMFCKLIFMRYFFLQKIVCQNATFIRCNPIFYWTTFSLHASSFIPFSRSMYNYITIYLLNCSFFHHPFSILFSWSIYFLILFKGHNRYIKTTLYLAQKKSRKY